MNSKEISEIRRRLNPDKNAITSLRGCYVNEKREIVSSFHRPFLSFPPEESEKYLALFRRVLSGAPGRNLLNVGFSADQMLQEDGAHHLLMELNRSALTSDDGMDQLYRQIIDALQLEGNYLILALHDAYDVPFRRQDGSGDDEFSDEVFQYILLAVCPVKLTRPGLSYVAEDNSFHALNPDWIVAAPELGFMFPAFDDRAANLYSALYYTRDAGNVHGEFIDAVFQSEPPMPATEQKEAFRAVLEDSLEQSLDLEVVQTLHDTLRDRLEEHGRDKAAAPLEVSRRELVSLLEDCDVPEEELHAFEARYDEAFGETMPLTVANVIEPKKYELRTPDVVVQVNPERSDLVETRVIDGQRYILIRAEEGVEINGVNIRIREQG